MGNCAESCSRELFLYAGGNYIRARRGILVTGGATIQIPNMDLHRTVYYAILEKDGL